MLKVHAQASDGATGKGHEAVPAALQRRATTLAVDITVGDDRVRGGVNLKALPVRADWGAVAVAGAAGGPVLGRKSLSAYLR
jgi:hypothetical protein